MSIFLRSVISKSLLRPVIASAIRDILQLPATLNIKGIPCRLREKVKARLIKEPDRGGIGQAGLSFADLKLMAEFDGAGQLVREYIYFGNQLVADYRGGTTYFYYATDQVNSTRAVTDSSGTVVYSVAYDPYGGIQKTWGTPTYTPSLKFSGKERDQESQLDYFGARYFASFYYRWLSVDPSMNKGEALIKPQLWNLYSFCRGNPVTFCDPEGGKDLPFNAARDCPITALPGTATPLIEGKYAQNRKAYNCHSYAWHDSKGDPTDPRNEFPISQGARRWDNFPDDDISEQGYIPLDSDAPNKPGDRVIYYIDKNNNGRWDKTEDIVHSAIVADVDSEGNTTLVIGKMGDQAISFNHPNAPGYYDNSKGQATSRNYFRKGQ